MSEAEYVIDCLHDEVEEAMEIALRLMHAVCVHVPEEEGGKGRDEKEKIKKRMKLPMCFLE